MDFTYCTFNWQLLGSDANPWYGKCNHQQQQSFYGPLSSLFKLRAWQSFCTTSFHVLFGLPLGLEPSTSYSIHFFTQSVSSFRSTCPYHRYLFCCSINIISSIPSLSLNSLLGSLSFTLTLHIHLTILISASWSATSFSFLTGQVSLPCTTTSHTTAIQPPSPNQLHIPIGNKLLLTREEVLLSSRNKGRAPCEKHFIGLRNVHRYMRILQNCYPCTLTTKPPFYAHEWSTALSAVQCSQVVV